MDLWLVVLGLRQDVYEEIIKNDLLHGFIGSLDI